MRVRAQSGCRCKPRTGAWTHGAGRGTGLRRSLEKGARKWTGGVHATPSGSGDGGFAAAGYLVSFGIGWLLQADGVDPGGGRTNNLWLIWMISDLCLCTLGYAAEVLMRRKRSRESENRPS